MNIQQIFRNGSGNVDKKSYDRPGLINFVTVPNIQAGFIKKQGMPVILLWLICVTVMFASFPMDVLARTFRVEKAFKEVNLRGYTRSIKTAVISAEVTGKLLELNYDVGDVIGEMPLARIDSTFVDFDIRETDVALARINIRIKQINSRITYLTREFERKQSLFSKGRATEVIRDAAAQELEQAVLELKTVKQEAKSLGVTLTRLKENKVRHGVRAPKKWVVTEKKVEVGEVIQAGMPLAVVQDFTQLVVPLSVSGDELAGVLEKTEIFTARLEDHTVRARVDYISPEFDEATRKIRIQLIIPDAGMPHRGGLRFFMQVRSRMPGLKIPALAVVNRYANPRVFVEGRDDPLGVTILDTIGEELIIADIPGIAAGDLLIDPGEKAP